jgi:hypothetical protein
MPLLTRELGTTAAHTFLERFIELFKRAESAVGGFWSGLGITTAVSALVAYVEYRFKKSDITDLYKKELAAQLGKSEKEVNVDDLEKLGTVNHTINEQLVKTKKERNIDVGTIFAATMASVAITGAAVAAAITLGFLAPTGIATWLAGTAIGMLAYMVVKSPIQKVGEKLFGVDKKTTHERIEEISKEHQAGKVVSRERVFAVFVHANPKLDEFIKANYGKEFDKLKVGQKIRIADEIGNQLGIGKITDDINQGQVKATELAFAVQGNFSGVAPTLGDAPKSAVGRFKEKVAEAVGYHPADDKPEGFSFAQREKERRTAPTQLQL